MFIYLLLTFVFASFLYPGFCDAEVTLTLIGDDVVDKDGERVLQIAPTFSADVVERPLGNVAFTGTVTSVQSLKAVRLARMNVSNGGHRIAYCEKNSQPGSFNSTNFITGSFTLRLSKVSCTHAGNYAFQAYYAVQNDADEVLMSQRTLAVEVKPGSVTIKNFGVKSGLDDTWLVGNVLRLNCSGFAGTVTNASGISIVWQKTDSSDHFQTIDNNTLYTALQLISFYDGCVFTANSRLTMELSMSDANKRIRCYIINSNINLNTMGTALEYLIGTVTDYDTSTSSDVDPPVSAASSAGVIIGVTLAVIVAAVVVAILIYVVVFKRRSEKKLPGNGMNVGQPAQAGPDPYSVKSSVGSSNAVYSFPKKRDYSSSSAGRGEDAHSTKSYDDNNDVQTQPDVQTGSRNKAYLNDDTSRYSSVEKCGPGNRTEVSRSRSSLQGVGDPYVGTAI